MNTLINIIPRPQKYEFQSNHINLDDGWSVTAEGQAAVALKTRFTEQLCLAPESAGKQFQLRETSSLSPEAYEIRISEDEITVTAADKRGFYYALQTLKQLEYSRQFPVGTIQDEPSLAIRGFHLELIGVRKLDFTSMKRIIEKAGEFKLNTIFIEYGSRFPYLKNPEVSAVDSLTREQVHSLLAIAKENYIQVVPLLQSFGHLEYALQHQKYRELREVADTPQQLCPSNPESLNFFKNLAEEILEIHTDSDYFHIGGDETRQLGLCAKCRDKVSRIGKGGLFLDYVNEVCNWLKSKGKKPILWDDMLCTYPDILDRLDRNAVIMYWDYWSGSKPVPYLVPRYRPAGTKAIPMCIAYDRRWDAEWRNEPHPEYMRNFAEPIDFESELGNDFLLRFKQYLGPEFPRLINSFPYLKFYLDKGFSVIGAPTCLGEITDMPDGLENQTRSIANIQGFARNLTRNSAMGIVTTAWFNFPPEYLYHGLILTAHSAWNSNQVEKETQNP